MLPGTAQPGTAQPGAEPPAPGRLGASRSLLPAVTVLTVLLAIVAAAFAPIWEGPRRSDPVPIPVPTYTPPEMTAPEPIEAEPMEPVDVPSWVGEAFVWTLIGLLVLLVAVVIARLVASQLDQWRRHRTFEPVPEAAVGGAEIAAEIEPDLPALRRGVRAAEAVLDEAREPADAVVAAWLELEAAAADSGVPRDRAQTPTEFTAAVLQATTADAAAIETLLRLYHRARFATGEDARIGTEDVTAVRTSLRRLAESWGPA